MAGVFSHKLRLHPVLASGLAWCVQAPYVFITDYIWFVSTRTMPPEVAMTVVSSILLKLTVEAIISAVMSALLVKYLQRIGVLQLVN
jgi:hypothetical protein